MLFATERFRGLAGYNRLIILLFEEISAVISAVIRRSDKCGDKAR